MKTLTVRLPDALVAQIDAEAKARDESKSDVVRRRLQGGAGVPQRRAAAYDAISDLIGSVDGLAPDLASRTKHYLRTYAYGRKRSR
jgi:Arc/MetJ-type ribon-helix-helix transcriptional regulator